MQIKYDSNNSGGRWWLSDDDWKALERAGWFVQWGGLYFCRSNFSWHAAPEGAEQPCPEGVECQGHRKYSTAAEAEGNRYMRALAREAYREGLTPAEAMREFERVTGQNVMDEGCSCCGAPHTFNWRDEAGNYRYASGEDCAAYLFGTDAPRTLREALERR
jgi:hypothetical protein